MALCTSSSAGAKRHVRAFGTARQALCRAPRAAAPITRGKETLPSPEAPPDLSAAPPFTLSDLRQAIPEHCWERNTARSFSFLVRDVAIVFGLAAGAFAVNSWFLWPLYWLAQGTMFWALFVVGHDCGHQSFSNNQRLNNFVGNIVHASILVPYHGWRISHRTHHANHGHVENDESWYPATKSVYEKMEPMARMGRLLFPVPLLAYPFYLWSRSPGKEGSHFDPACNLFKASEAGMILTSNAFMIAMLGVLGFATFQLGPLAMFNLYFMPYWVGVMWLDIVTYLHHHGSSDPQEKMPWYRGEEWSYLRGGLTALDRDYGIFNKIHHDIGTHVIHHLFPQIPHYHLEDATEACKPVMGPYYRKVEASSGPLPTHLVEPLVRSFQQDHYVEDEGDVVFYKQDKALSLGSVLKDATGGK